MNKTYAVIWNHASGCWSVASEHARRHGKVGSGRRAIATAATLLGALAATSAYALPSGQQIVSGSGAITTSADGKAMTIDQQSNKLITNWQDFSVGGGERVQFNQPTSQSIALNRVIGQNGSQIQGQIGANGKVFLVNPNGVVFGSGAQVNVGGLVASTRDISDKDFLAGNYRFTGTSSGKVVNNGAITAAEGGSVALLGAQVSNNGVIQAQMGSVALGAGNDVKVNFDGSGLLSLQVEGGAVDAQVHNGGLLKANGGEVLMTARAAGDLLGAVVNNSGTIEAKGLSARAGKITLDGGLVQVAGKLDASARDADAAGGSVTTHGERIEVSRDVQVDTRATSGRTGKWTIAAANADVGADATGKPLTRGVVIDGGMDGNTGNGGNESVDVSVGIGGNAGNGGTGGNGTGVVVGGNGNGGSGMAGDAAIDATTLSRILGTTNVELDKTAGNLKVGGDVKWSSDNALTLTARNGDVDLNKSLAATGEQAGLAVNAGGRIRVNDKVALTGQNSSLELNSGSGHTLSDGASFTLSGANASFRSNGESYRVIHNLDQLREVEKDMDKGRFVLGEEIDGKGQSFRTIGDSYTFNGRFDGLGNTIRNLAVYGTGPYIGLFGANGGVIGNLKLESLSVTGARSYWGNGPALIGGLAGVNIGTISNVKAKDVSIKAGTNRVQVLGGLVGMNLSGTIDRASVTGRIEGNRFTAAAGGLVGEHVTSPDPKYRVATITNSGADMAIAGTVMDQRTISGGVGGLVGRSTNAVIERSTSAGSIALSNSNGTTVGGLVGVNEGGRIDAADANVTVSLNGSDTVIGGLVGRNDGGRISASNARGNVAGGYRARVGGLVGHNTGVITASNAYGSAAGGGESHVGGLVGRNDAGQISASNANGSATGGNDSYVGGLVGRNDGGRISASNASGNATGGARARVGGLAGHNTGVITASNAHGKATGGNDSHVGGLVGYNDDGTISASNASGDVAAGDRSNAGGVVGTNGGTVTRVSAQGNVRVGREGMAGGIVGTNFVAGKRASVTDSSTSSDVTGGDYAQVGGIAGNNGATVERSSASGTVSGGRYARLGGLAGANFGTIRQSSTSSRIAYVAGYSQIYGGLAGISFGTLASNSATGDAAKVKAVGAGMAPR